MRAATVLACLALLALCGGATAVFGKSKEECARKCEKKSVRNYGQSDYSVYKPILNKRGQCKCKLASIPGCSKKINRCKCRSKSVPKRTYLNDNGCPECCCEDDGRFRCVTTTTVTATNATTTTSTSTTTNEPDTAPPQLSCSIVTVAATAPAFTSATNVEYGVEVTDDVSEVTAVCDPPSGNNTFTLGKTTISCSASDKAGNTANCSFEVLISDPRSPACANATQGDPCALGSLSDSVIPNPSFENNTGCPTSPGQLSKAVTWVQATSATSDYFIGGDSCTVHSANHFGPDISLPAADGDAFVGAIWFSGYYEYVGACLEEPLKAGEAQTLEMFVRATMGGNYGGDTDGWVDLFCIDSCTLPLSATNSLRGQQTLLATAKPATRLIGGSGDWQTVSLQFTPPKDCPAVIFGPASDMETMPPPAGKSGGYLLFDSLNLQQGQGTCNDEGLCMPN